MTGKGYNHPEWLNSLRKGDSPLLSSDEWAFLAEIRSRIVESAKNGAYPDCVRDFGGEDLEFKLSLLKDNFEKVVEYLKRCSGPKNYFLEYFTNWKFVREMNVAELMEIAKEVEDVGPVLPPDLVAGTATSAASSFCEAGHLLVKVKRAVKIIEDDRELSQKLWSWMSDAKALEEALERIRHIDVERCIRWAAAEFQRLCDGKKKRNKSSLEKEIQAILKSFVGLRPELAQEVADAVGILTASYIIFRRNAPVFNLAFNFYKLSRMVPVACNAIRGLVCAMRVTKGGGKLTREMKMGMVLDGIDVAQVLQALSSENETAKCIVRAAEELRKELDVFEKVNHRLTTES